MSWEAGCAVGIFQKFRERRAAKKLLRSTLGLALLKLTTRYFDETGLAKHKKKVREEIVSGLLSKISAILRDENPLLKLREEIGATAYVYAGVEVLCLVDKASVGLSNCPYVSGDLRQHIRKCISHNVTLKPVVSELLEHTDQDIIDFCENESAINLYYLQGLILVRVQFKDTVPDASKDWFRPLITSLLIYSESCYREAIGLPSLQTDPLGLSALRHSTFLNIVAHGYPNPLVEWEKQYKLVHADDVAGLSAES